ncbi:recombinase RecT [Bacteroides fragilis]
MEAQNQNGSQTPQNLPLLQKNITDTVMSRVKDLEEAGGIIFPQNYSAVNHIKSAWFDLQQTKDKDGRPALQVCTADSIANSLLDMVIQALSVSKKQGYFIVYGNRLEFQRSYFGTIALAKRVGMKDEPVANVIYEGDNFIYQIDPKTGLTEIVKHEQKLENIDNSKIKGAYAIVNLPSGKTQTTLMTIAQIRAAWGQGATKGNSPAHKNFGEEMSKKSVIGRACKTIINSSDDSWLYEGKHDEMDEKENPAELRDATKDAAGNKKPIGEIVDFEEVPTGNEKKAPDSPKTTEQPKEQQNNSNEQQAPAGPGY